MLNRLQVNVSVHHEYTLRLISQFEEWHKMKHQVLQGKKAAWCSSWNFREPRRGQSARLHKASSIGQASSCRRSRHQLSAAVASSSAVCQLARCRRLLQTQVFLTKHHWCSVFHLLNATKGRSGESEGNRGLSPRLRFEPPTPLSARIWAYPAHFGPMMLFTVWK